MATQTITTMTTTTAPGRMILSPMSSIPSSSPKPFRLLDLPHELIILVTEQTSLMDIDEPAQKTSSHYATLPIVRLAETCRLMNKICLDTFLRTTQFHHCYLDKRRSSIYIDKTRSSSTPTKALRKRFGLPQQWLPHVNNITLQSEGIRGLTHLWNDMEKQKLTTEKRFRPSDLAEKAELAETAMNTGDDANALDQTWLNAAQYCLSRASFPSVRRVKFNLTNMQPIGSTLVQSHVFGNQLRVENGQVVLPSDEEGEEFASRIVDLFPALESVTIDRTSAAGSPVLRMDKCFWDSDAHYSPVSASTPNPFAPPPSAEEAKEEKARLEQTLQERSASLDVQLAEHDQKLTALVRKMIVERNQ